ncbi:MAG: hypothetical protein HZB39_16485 [Planctomycetes bacterium]|nr:hypothetical protein [Planctomycetota bacterium]
MRDIAPDPTWPETASGSITSGAARRVQRAPSLVMMARSMNGAASVRWFGGALTTA